MARNKDKKPKKQPELEAEKQPEAQAEMQPDNRDDALFERMQRNKKRRKRRIWITVICIVLAVLIALTATVIILRNRVRRKFASNTADVLTYAASVGSISTTVSGSGTLQDVDLQDVTVPADVEVEEIVVEANQKVSEGDVIAKLDLSSVMSAMSKVQSELDDFDDQLSDAEDDAVSTSLKAGVSGRVKAVYCAEDDAVADCMYENGALMILSVDGYMSAELPAGSLQVGDSLTAKFGDDEADAVVDSIDGDTALVLVDDDGPAEGETVSFYTEDDETVGSAEATVHNPLKITGFAGTVSSVNVSEGDKVSASTSVLTLSDTEYSANYEAILRSREEKEEELMELLKLYHDGALLSPISGSVTYIADLDAETDDTALLYDTAAGSTDQLIATLSPDALMSITINVDETDILSLEKEQTVEITVDSIGEDVFEGTVAEINKTASSTSGVTNYSTEIRLEKNEKMLAGMNADAVIRIQGVDDAIIIPVDALHQTSDSAYVYTSYDEETKQYGGMVEVTTGLSNSNYVEITSGLSEGQTVYYTERQSGNPFFGGMSGFGDMGGFSMPSGDFGGNMPSGGFSGMPGGSMPGGRGQSGGFSGMPGGRSQGGSMPGGGNRSFD